VVQNLTSAQPNRYYVCVPYNGYERYLRLFEYLRDDDGGRLSVTFSSNRTGARLPNPRLLALHAACARAAHTSGAAWVLDKLEYDEETSDLASDGSSARLLSDLMAPFAVIPGVV